MSEHPPGGTKDSHKAEAGAAPQEEAHEAAGASHESTGGATGSPEGAGDQAEAKAKAEDLKKKHAGGGGSGGGAEQSAKPASGGGGTSKTHKVHAGGGHGGGFWGMVGGVLTLAGHVAARAFTETVKVFSSGSSGSKSSDSHAKPAAAHPH